MMGGYKKPICPETEKPCETGCRFGACAQRRDEVRRTAKAITAVRGLELVKGTRLTS